MPKALSGCKVGPLGRFADNMRTRKENQGRKAKGIFPGPRGSQWGQDQQDSQGLLLTSKKTTGGARKALQPKQPEPPTQEQGACEAAGPFICSQDKALSPQATLGGQVAGELAFCSWKGFPLLGAEGAQSMWKFY